MKGIGSQVADTQPSSIDNFVLEDSGVHFV